MHDTKGKKEKLSCIISYNVPFWFAQKKSAHILKSPNCGMLSQPFKLALQDFICKDTQMMIQCMTKGKKKEKNYHV